MHARQGHVGACRRGRASWLSRTTTPASAGACTGCRSFLRLFISAARHESPASPGSRPGRVRGLVGRDVSARDGMVGICARVHLGRHARGPEVVDESDVTDLRARPGTGRGHSSSAHVATQPSAATHTHAISTIQPACASQDPCRAHPSLTRPRSTCQRCWAMVVALSHVQRQ